MKKFIFVLFLVSCSSKYLKYEKEKQLIKNEEFERKVEIISADASVSTPVSVPASSPITEDAASVKPEKKKTPTKTKEKKVVPLKKPRLRQPDVEDRVGFLDGQRRPIKDPFVVGEKVVHEMSYFTAKAGLLTMEIKPMAQVNQRLSYHFFIGLKSSGLFSNFYSVDDQVNTFLDYEELVPYVLKVSIKESGKLAQSQSYFDFQTNKANFWEKKYTEKSGEEERKFSWDILPYSQNAFSGLYYMRIFDWKVGKEIAFQVAEDKKNIIFKGTAVAEEVLNTEAGEFKTLKIKASILSRGALTQTGDVFLWITNDDRKYIVRIEAKIKIGTIVSEVIEIKPGKVNQ